MGKISIDRNGVDLVMVEGNSGKDKGVLEKRVSCFVGTWCIYLGVEGLSWEGGLLLLSLGMGVGPRSLD